MTCFPSQNSLWLRLSDLVHARGILGGGIGSCGFSLVLTPTRFIEFSGINISGIEFHENHSSKNGNVLLIASKCFELRDFEDF